MVPIDGYWQLPRPSKRWSGSRLAQVYARPALPRRISVNPRSQPADLPRVRAIVRSHQPPGQRGLRPGTVMGRGEGFDAISRTVRKRFVCHLSWSYLRTRAARPMGAGRRPDPAVPNPRGQTARKRPRLPGP